MILEEGEHNNAIAFACDNCLSLAGEADKEIGGEDGALVVQKDTKDISDVDCCQGKEVVTINDD